ncbi:MAG: nitroreductase family deazaflavin-dependent oxidoreductase [Caulobacteraceae bacterium]|nr:nitroreductase family deazaflavin-dependent oxidoreductase [Caulobacteraceae bacterium]
MATKLAFGSPDFAQQHLELYLKTDGAEGHVADFRPIGGLEETPCLLLKTTGRRTGKPSLLPLIYGKEGKDFVIVASKGGAPENPGWFLNLQASPEVEFQVAAKKYKGVARVTKGDERARLFAMMDVVYPPYTSYQAKTTREIPVVVLEPRQEIPRL